MNSANGIFPKRKPGFAGAPFMEWILALGVIAACVLACWVIPYRLATEPRGSYYTPTYNGDEFYYAQKVQPLITGTTPQNTVNGIHNPKLVSPWFIDDFVRVLVNVSGVHVLTFIWAWRILFPLALCGCLAALIHATLPARQRTWHTGLRLSALGATFAGLYFLYDCVIPYPPLQGFINRFPTNLEYLLSVLIAAFYVQLLRRGSLRWALALGLTLAATCYIRPYLAIPWGPAVTLGVAALLWKRELAWKPTLLLYGSLTVAMIPFLLVAYTNKQQPDNLDIMSRFFPPRGFEVHFRWPLFLITAALVAVSTRYIEGRLRLFTLSTAAVLAALPFVCSFFGVAHELLMYDRFGVYYLIVFVTAALLVLAKFQAQWRGHAGESNAARAALALKIAGVLFALVVGARNATFDFWNGGPATTRVIADESRCVPAYDWIRTNTPDNALFLVDDGLDWTKAPERMEELLPLLQTLSGREDLFPVVARRRRVFCETINRTMAANADLELFATLQRGTFGYAVGKPQYLAALKTLKPAYVLWRKTAVYPLTTEPAPIPRGFGAQLKTLSRTVYSDEFCEIWALNYSPSAKTPQ